jgi:hypothetical protein
MRRSRGEGDLHGGRAGRQSAWRYYNAVPIGLLEDLGRLRAGKMISVGMLAENFYPVVISGDLARCADELRDTIVYTYFLLPEREGGIVPFVISQEVVDDDFARQILIAAQGDKIPSIKKVPLGANARGYSHLILAPAHYHAELKGRLDEERSSTILAIPIFHSEFSGDETVEEFLTLRRHLVPTRQWGRTVHPKIRLRFDNKMTGGGTGANYVLVKFDQLESEIDNLTGVGDGFIEVVNYKGDVIELLSSGEATFSLIRDRNDGGATIVSKSEARRQIWETLNG